MSCCIRGPRSCPPFFGRSEFSPHLNIDPFSGWVREIGNGGGGETAPHLNGDGEGDWTMKVGGRKERIVVSQDEIAMRIQRKMEYVGKCKIIKWMAAYSD